MDKDKANYFKKRLLDEKRELIETIDGMKENGLGYSQREEVDELSMVDNHPGDMGTEMFDKGRRFALLNNEEDIIERIDDAIERIDKGRYGICELCGKEINDERLEALPYATTCIECENKKRDHGTYKYDRPVEEETLMPYGGYFRDVSGDSENDLMFDAEDSWQQVAKFEKRPGIVRNFDDIDSEYINGDETDDDSGIVEFTDGISNQQYKNQLP